MSAVELAFEAVLSHISSLVKPEGSFHSLKGFKSIENSKSNGIF